MGLLSFIKEAGEKLFSKAEAKTAIAEAQAAGCPIVHGPFTEGHAAAWALVPGTAVAPRCNASDLD